MKEISRWATALSVAAMALLTSCSKDEETKDPAVTDAIGRYEGKMNYASKEKPEPLEAGNPDESPSVDVKCAVENGKVRFADFPVAPLVAAVVGEEAAPGIVEKIGKVTYEMDYLPVLNDAKDLVLMTLTAAPLEISFPASPSPLSDEQTDVKVKVTVTAPRQAAYSIGDRTLTFELDADQVQVGELPLEGFVPLRLEFALAKK